MSQRFARDPCIILVADLRWSPYAEAASAADFESDGERALVFGLGADDLRLPRQTCFQFCPLRAMINTVSSRRQTTRGSVKPASR